MGRRTIAIVLAIVLAMAAAGLVWWYVGSVKTQAAEQEEMTTVLVAKEDIPARATGEAIVENGLVSPEQIPLRFAAPGALTDESQLNGQVIQASLGKGQQLLAGQLALAQEESLAFQIDNGMRAVSVSIDRVRGVGGLIREGDRVDVLVTFEYEIFNQGNVNLGEVMPPAEVERIRQDAGIDLGASKSAVTRIILQQVQVLRIDPVDKQAASATAEQSGDASEAPNSPVVVLLVTPQDAERLVFAQEQGTVSFALVPAEDFGAADTPGRAIVNEFQPSSTLPPLQALQPVSTSQ